jgi:hypothetical protein
MAFLPPGTDLSHVTVGSQPATPETVEAAIAAMPPAQQGSMIRMIIAGDKVGLREPAGRSYNEAAAQRAVSRGSSNAATQATAKAADLNSKAEAGQLGVAPGAAAAPAPAPAPTPTPDPLVAAFDKTYTDPATGVSPLSDPRVRASAGYKAALADFLAKNKAKTQAPAPVSTPTPPGPISDLGVNPNLLSSLLNTYRG